MVRKTLFRRWREDAVKIFKAGVRAVDPSVCIPRVLSREDQTFKFDRWRWHITGKVWVFGAGKASARMAQVVESIAGDVLAGGVVITKDGHGLPTRKVEVLESAHPIPDERTLEAVRRMTDSMKAVGKDDLVLFLISGGASALMEWPKQGVSLEDIQEVTRQLLHCGASIHEINTVRKHLSRIKGGQILRFLPPAVVWTLLISDVVGGRLDSIGSGPTVPDPTTYQDAFNVLERYGLLDRVPASVVDLIRRGCRGDEEETLKPGDPRFRSVRTRIVADNQMALVAAAREARSRGYHPLTVSSFVDTETHETARMLVAIARQVLRYGQPVRPPACLFFGGETTLTVRGKGKGGRNQELALFAGLLLEPDEPIVVLSGGTDGTDGPTDAAGGVIDATLIEKARQNGIHPEEYLADNNAYPCLERIGGLIKTGPTYTNVMDLMLAIVGR